MVEVFSVHGFNIKPIERYKVSNVKIRYKCFKCKHVWKAIPNNVTNLESGCNKCAGIKKRKQFKMSQNEYEKKVAKVSKGTIKVLGVYINNKVKIPHECMTCRHVWDASPSNIMRGKGCPKCSKVYRPSQKEYERLVHKISNGTIKVIGKYKNAKIGIVHECMTCGTEWKVTPYSITGLKTGCPNCCFKGYLKAAISCLNTMSKKLNLLIQHAENGGEYRVNGYRLDGYIPSLNTAIEFHGNYWHRRDWRIYVKSCVRDWDISRHLNLVVVWENDWNANPERVIEKIKRFS